MKLVKINKIVVLIFSIFACSSENTIEKEKLAHAYVDLLLADELYASTDSLESKKAEIYIKYSITKENYDSSFKAFEDKSEEWNEFFELANSYLDSLKVEQNRIEKEE